MPDTMRSMRPVEQLRERDVDAVGRRAVDLVNALADLLHPQRPAQRQRVADGARLDIRRDDGHVSEPAQRLGERDECRPSVRRRRW